MLRVGAVSLLLPSCLPQAFAAPRPLPTAKTVILLWMDGGMSHLDTFDPKPEAEHALRGPFGAMATSADGIRICDRLPRLARHADQCAILRGVAHNEGGHERAAHLVLTGRPLASTQNVPDFGKILQQFRTNSHDFAPVSSPPAARTAAERQSEAAYGNTNFGRACLAARRGAEAGVPFVRATLTGWDVHEDCFPRLQNAMLPILDTAFSALLDDLRQRELLESTLVVCMGEFGRSPRLNANRLPGRDHWPAAMSVVLAGGGIAGGQVLGATDRDEMAPLESALHPQDVLATIYHLAGVSVPDANRVDGRVLHEICS